MSLFVIPAVLLALGWVYLIGSGIAAFRFGRQGTVLPAMSRPVSILKPLYGEEPGLYANLRSFAEQDHPSFQVVLGMRDPRDPAGMAARKLTADLPDRDITIVVDPRPAFGNLKVANLENMLPHARHEILVIADADIRVDRHYLAAILPPLDDPRTGLVTCLYRGVSTGGIWSDLGALHVNFGFLPGALLAQAIRVGGGCFGATIALRRADLDRAGGFARLRDELADDHRLGAAIRELGLAVVLSPYVVETRVCETNFRQLWQHELRWARTNLMLAPWGIAGSVVTHPVPIAALALLASRFALTSIAFFVISCALRWAQVRVVAQALGIGRVPFWQLLVRDALSLAVWVAGFFGRTVSWRGQRVSAKSRGGMTVEEETAP
jgi:ceramide glucosyltransferase